VKVFTTSSKGLRESRGELSICQSLQAVALHVLDNMRVDGALEAMAVTAILLCCGTLDTHWVAGAVGTWAFAVGVGLSEGALDSLVLCFVELVNVSYIMSRKRLTW
jgi:hypothetical protein